MIAADLKARWFLARSDVEAAAHLDIPERTADYMRRHWPHWFEADAYRAVYEEAGRIEAEQTDTFQKIPEQARYVVTSQVIQTRIVSHLPADARVLDYGASRGLWAIHLANQMPSLVHWTLADCDARSIAEARRFVSDLAVKGREWAFVTGDYRSLSGEYDLALFLDVLEHVPDPHEAVCEIERRTRGYIVISVPFGPHEYEMWIRHPERRREHIREWPYPDLMEIFAGKPELEIFQIAYGQNGTGDSLGHHVVKYRADGERLWPVNWDRKLDAQQFRAVALPD